MNNVTILDSGHYWFIEIVVIIYLLCGNINFHHTRLYYMNSGIQKKKFRFILIHPIFTWHNGQNRVWKFSTWDVWMWKKNVIIIIIIIFIEPNCIFFINYAKKNNNNKKNTKILWIWFLWPEKLLHHHRHRHLTWKKLHFVHHLLVDQMNVESAKKKQNNTEKKVKNLHLSRNLSFKLSEKKDDDEKKNHTESQTKKKNMP